MINILNLKNQELLPLGCPMWAGTLIQKFRKNEHVCVHMTCE